MNTAADKGMNFLALSVLLLMLFGLVAAASALARTEPLPQIEEAVQGIIRILEDKSLASADLKEEKRSRIMAIVERHFDFREMSKRTLAKHWKTRSADEQEQFVKKFAKLLEETYIKKIENYSGEKVFFKKQDIQGDKAIVYTGFVRNNIETPVNYKLLSASESWMVYDVIIEGVSLVSNWRSQFDSIMSKENFAGLLARVDEKILAAESGEAEKQSK